MTSYIFFFFRNSIIVLTFSYHTPYSSHLFSSTGIVLLSILNFYPHSHLMSLQTTSSNRPSTTVHLLSHPGLKYQWTKTYSTQRVNSIVNFILQTKQQSQLILFFDIFFFVLVSQLHRRRCYHNQTLVEKL